MAGFPCRICARFREQLRGSEDLLCVFRWREGPGLIQKSWDASVFSSEILKDKACPPFLQVALEEVGGGCRTSMDGGHGVRNVQ